MSTTIQETPPPEPQEFELALFDNAAYRRPSRIGVRVGGVVWLDPADEKDRALIEQLAPGAAVSWRFEGMCVGGAVKIKTDADGQVEGREFMGAVTVESVYQG